MSFEQGKPDLEMLLSHIAGGKLLEIQYPRLELKSEWSKDCGQDISAIANHESQTGGWLIVGLNDKGILQEKNEGWAKAREELLGDQINRLLSPYYSVGEIHVQDIRGSFLILLDIQSPGDVTEWNGEAYKLWLYPSFSEPKVQIP